MTSETAQLVAIAFTFLLMAGLGVALLIVTIKVSPRATRRDLRLRRPGKRTRGGMYAVALLHVLAGVIVVTQVPGAGFGIFLVCLAAACIYWLMAEAYALMLRTGLRPGGLHEHHGE
jgi:hypothetical protein